MSPAEGFAPFWGPTLDCPDPQELAEFYQRLGGGTITVSSENFVELRCDGGAAGIAVKLSAVAVRMIR